MTTVTANTANGDEAANTEIKQLAGAEAPGPSCASGGAQQKTGFQPPLITLVHRSKAHQPVLKISRIILIPI